MVENSSSNLNKKFTKVIGDFASATKFGAVLVDTHGNERSDLYNFSPFCQLMRKNPKYREKCQKCDAMGGFLSKRNNKPSIHRCHAGLIDISFSIQENNKLSGYLLIGQVQTEDNSEKSFDYIHTLSDWKKEKDLRKAREQIHTVSLKQLQSTVSLVESISDYHFRQENPISNVTISRDNKNFQNRTNNNYSPLNRDVDKVVEFIQNNLSKPITLEEIAKDIYLSPWYLSRPFKKEMGTTFVKYLNQQRMEYAIYLLNNTDFSIDQISKKTGYRQASYFCRIFKEYYNMTPSIYRHNYNNPL